MSSTVAEKKFVLLQAGMHDMPESMSDKPRLYAQRCSNCSEAFSSLSRVYCANCGKETMQRMLLSTSGTIYTYTVVHQPLRGSLMEPPYVIAQVRMPEGVSIQTIMTDIEPDRMKIGMEVEICLKQVDENDEGEAVVNYFFRPVAAS